MDDPKDGGGPRATTATFCSNSAPAGTTDKNPEDYKRVDGHRRLDGEARARARATQTGIINNPGSASGPAVRSIIPRGYTSPYMVTTDVNTVTVDVSTSSKPTTMAWMLDGSRQSSPVTPNGVHRAALAVRLEHQDARGRRLRRRGRGLRRLRRLRPEPPGDRRPQPLPAQAAQAGRRRPHEVRHGRDRVDGQQRARHHRLPGLPRRRRPSPVCDIATQKLETFCIDTSPPGADALEYYVRAYDRTRPGNVRASADSTHLIVTKDNNAPYQVQGLALTPSSPTGDTKLTWTRPSPGGPGRGRLHLLLPDLPRRDPHEQPLRALLRLERLADGHLDATSTRTACAHAYWVTAVDQHYAESALRPPGDRMSRLRANDGFTVIELAVAGRDLARDPGACR